jgi:hypothetical protein
MNWAIYFPKSFPVFNFGRFLFNSLSAVESGQTPLVVAA